MTRESGGNLAVRGSFRHFEFSIFESIQILKFSLFPNIRFFKKTKKWNLMLHFDMFCFRTRCHSHHQFHALVGFFHSFKGQCSTRSVFPWRAYWTCAAVLTHPSILTLIMAVSNGCYLLMTFYDANATCTVYPPSVINWQHCKHYQVGGWVRKEQVIIAMRTVLSRDMLSFLLSPVHPTCINVTQPYT